MGHTVTPKKMEHYYERFYGQISYVSVESVQTAITFICMMISLTVHLLKHTSIILCLTIGFGTGFSLSLLCEYLHYNQLKLRGLAKNKDRIKRVSRRSYVVLTAILFLLFCLLALLFVYSHESVVIHKIGDTPSLKVKAEGCEIVLTNSKDDATVKLSVFTPYGSALGTKSLGSGKGAR